VAGPDGCAWEAHADDAPIAGVELVLLLAFRDTIGKTLHIGIPFAVCQVMYVPIVVTNKPIAPIATSAACSLSPRFIMGTKVSGE
jgi:hypothetical protein